jgi:hypothetical protein
VIKDKTGSNFGGLVLLGACCIGVAILAFVVANTRKNPVTHSSVSESKPD